MSDERSVVVDATVTEARQIAHILDLGAAIVECLEDAPSREQVEEYRNRFLAGIAIAECEAVLRGEAR